MTVNIAAKSDQELDQLIANFEGRHAFAHPHYLAALEERAQRSGSGAALEPRRTVALIRDAAKRRAFLSYGQIAEAYGIEFFKHRKTLFNHLGDVAGWSYHVIASRPLLSAVVVSKEHLGDGLMTGDTLAGFIRFAERVGAYRDGDQIAFLRAEQDKVFDWACKESLA